MANMIVNFNLLGKEVDIHFSLLGLIIFNEAKGMIIFRCSVMAQKQTLFLIRTTVIKI